MHSHGLELVEGSAAQSAERRVQGAGHEWKRGEGECRATWEGAEWSLADLAELGTASHILLRPTVKAVLDDLENHISVARR